MKRLFYPFIVSVPVWVLFFLLSLPTECFAHSTPINEKTRKGDVVTEADSVMRAEEARKSFNVAGNGIRIGVISDGVDGLFDSVESGDIPDGDNTSCDPGGEQGSAVACQTFDESHGIAAEGASEGTAMLEIVYDLAPGAELFFSNVETSADMAEAIDTLAGLVDVLVDDLGFYDEPFFEDGPVALAAQRAVDNGVIYVSAGGNDALNHVQQEFTDADNNGNTEFIGPETSLETFSFATFLDSQVGIFLQWDDDFDNATNDLDLFVDIDDDDDPANGFLESGSSETNNIGAQPSEFIGFTTTEEDGVLTVYVSVKRVTSDGTGLTFEIFTPGSFLNLEYDDPGDSVFGHPAVPDVVAVAAIDQEDDGNDTIEEFSSWGPATFLTETRNKPDVTGIDNVSVTAHGDFISPFPGTSAAAPHVAACIALMLEAVNGELSPGEIRAALYSTAVDLGDSGFDIVFGNGRADCYEAVAAVDRGGGQGSGETEGGSSGCSLVKNRQKKTPSLFLASALLLVFLALLLSALRKKGAFCLR